MVHDEVGVKIPVRQYIDNYLETHPGDVTSHYNMLKSAGYYPVCTNRYIGMPIHDWLIEHVGYDNYNWTGRVFWFNKEKDAIWFALKWG